MKPVSILLVKPHPPYAILDGQSPVSESYRYNWEPISLKYLAAFLERSFGNRIRVSVWHLIDRHDDELFLRAVAEEAPSIIGFSELDILVNEVNNLAGKIKSRRPDIWTAVGGKQTSLLRAGDRFPFRNIDFAFRGDGNLPMEQLVRNRLSGTIPEELPGLVKCSDEGTVVEPYVVNPRIDVNTIDAISVRSVSIENRSLSDYLDHTQSYPSIGVDKPRTASILIGSGCAHTCYVCQSPVEFGAAGSRVMLRRIDDVAQEILWLRERQGVNNFFSLESSLSLANLRDLYDRLEFYGINHLPLSGFVRVSDVVKAHRYGLLKQLAGKGLRVLSIGLDVPSRTGGDIYNKSFSYRDQVACLKICEELGIIVLATAIASPNTDRTELAEQLQLLAALPAAEVDIRLAIALRNTPYFHEMGKHLLHHPDHDALYYDRQNYRYQTMQIAGKVTPEETYDLVRCFQENYHVSRQHEEYVLRMVEKHPDTLPFFQRQYQNLSLEQRHISSAIKGVV